MKNKGPLDAPLKSRSPSFWKPGWLHFSRVTLNPKPLIMSRSPTSTRTTPPHTSCPR